MNWYIIVVCFAILACIGISLIRKYIIKSNSDSDMSVNMMTTGLTLVGSAFPGTKDTVISIIGDLLEIENISIGTDYGALICGVLLVLGGWLYKRDIKDRIFVLNMYGLFAQQEISDVQNVKALKLADFKVKEIVLDFVDIFDINMTKEINTIIIQKIEKVCAGFVDRSKDFKSCFTGMAPIPYTIFAGTHLASGNVRRYFEYKRSVSKYYELKKKRAMKKYEGICIEYPELENKDATEIVVTLSITRKVSKMDICQFGGMDIIEMGVRTPADNKIIYIEQLDEYVSVVIDKIEELKELYPNIKIVHLAASIPSCISIELGKKFALNANRLPQIISYHYVANGVKKYPFGVAITAGSTYNRGDLVKG